jgi:hypothetical protein
VPLRGIIGRVVLSQPHSWSSTARTIGVGAYTLCLDNGGISGADYWIEDGRLKIEETVFNLESEIFNR